MKKTILVAVDSTDEADQVVSAAQELASEGASLTLLTVIKPLVYAYGPEQSMLMSTTISFEEEAAKAAEERLAALATKHGLDCDKLVVVGPPAMEVRSRAESIGADLVVIGSHGRHGLGLLLGSTANGVLHGAPCDVFVVRIK